MANTEHLAPPDPTDPASQRASLGAQTFENAQTEALQIVPNQSDVEISYTTAAGETYSSTEGEALVCCPYLGSLSLVEANVILKLVALGQAKAAEKNEQPAVKPKTNNEFKPSETAQMPAKERANQKEQPLRVEPVLQTALDQPERVAALPTRLEVAELAVDSAADSKLEQANISDLADAVALSRHNFLYAEELAKPARLEVANEFMAARDASHYVEPAVSRHQVEPEQPLRSIEPAAQAEFLILEPAEQTELPVAGPVAELSLLVSEISVSEESDNEQNNGEISLPLDLALLSERLLYDSANQSEVADEALDKLPADGESSPVLSRVESSDAHALSAETATIEATNLLEAILPQPVHAKLETYLESAEPEPAAKVEELKGLIVEAIGQLQELLVSEAAEPKKVELLERVLEERYQALLQEIGVAIDETAFKRFMVQLRESIAQIPVEATRRAGLDEGTHEHKQNFGSVAQDLSQALTQKLRSMKLARFVVQASTA